jgi:hypothetical protein
MLIFDDNVIHRAVLARASHRDVMVLQLRPATSRVRPCIDPGWTGTFRHSPFNLDPGGIPPTVERARHFER